MEYRQLGKTAFCVSRLCFGSLAISPMQSGFSPQEGAHVLRYALERGVNFIDTAECYENYPHIRAGLAGWDKEVFVSSKCYAYTREMMRDSLEAARRALDRDRIDIFLLHEQESILTLKGHWEALEYLLEAKAKGLVGAVGLSTHMVAGARAALETPEIEVLHPIINFAGRGIVDGTAGEMLTVIEACHAAGKGIYGMKIFGGGTLGEQAKEALDWALRLDCLDAIALGMKSRLEIDNNIAWMEGERGWPEEMAKIKRRLFIEDYCQGCGSCVARCQQKALRMQDGRAVLDAEKCVLCGYCSTVCRDFCIKIV